MLLDGRIRIRTNKLRIQIRTNKFRIQEAQNLTDSEHCKDHLFFHFGAILGDHLGSVIHLVNVCALCAEEPGTDGPAEQIKAEPERGRSRFCQAGAKACKLFFYIFSDALALFVIPVIV